MNDAVVGSGLSFADRMQALLRRVDYRIAVLADHRRAIHLMRYDCYLREGAIDPNETGLFADHYDETPNALLLGVFVDGALASSLRLHVNTNDCSLMPDGGAFPDITDPMIAAGEKIINSSRFVVAHKASRAHPNLAYLTLRAGWMGAEWFDVDRILTATRAEHVPFYRRGFGCDVLCDVRPYPTLKKPLGLLSLDFRQTRDRIYRRYPFFMSTAFERATIFDPANLQHGVVHTEPWVFFQSDTADTPAVRSA